MALLPVHRLAPIILIAMPALAVVLPARAGEAAAPRPGADIGCPTTPARAAPSARRAPHRAPDLATERAADRAAERATERATERPPATVPASASTTRPSTPPAQDSSADPAQAHWRHHGVG